VYRRFGSILVLWGLLALALMGCVAGNDGTETSKPVPDGPYGSCTLQLTLPVSAIADWAPKRVSKLTIDDKDFSLPRGAKRQIKIDRPADPGTAVTIVFDFWPNTYTNIIRTTKVTLPKEATFAVDMTDTQPDDRIIPIYYPTPAAVVQEMCRMGKVGKDDVVYDIGCGDGRMVITAVKEFGAKKGVGIDIREELISLCKKNAKEAGVGDRVEFRQGDALKIMDWSDASVVLLYLGDYLNQALRPALQKTLKPGARIVSHRFKMGDWATDESKKINVTNNDGKPEDYVLHLWTIKKE
jgi:SAM-dependent methyltransferase